MVTGCGQDIGDDLGLEHPVVVLGIHVSVARLTPFFSPGERPNLEIKSCLNSSQQPLNWQLARLLTYGQLYLLLFTESSYLVLKLYARAEPQHNKEQVFFHNLEVHHVIEYPPTMATNSYCIYLESVSSQ